MSLAQICLDAGIHVPIHVYRVLQLQVVVHFEGPSPLFESRPLHKDLQDRRQLSNSSVFASKRIGHINRSFTVDRVVQCAID